MAADVSREGVQRDLLPLIEGTTVATKHGTVKTDHILFIASGAFHLAKPSDLLPELQGRLPIRVELDGRSLMEDFRAHPHRAGSQSDSSQYTALMATEEVTLEITEDGVERHRQPGRRDQQHGVENIGARRLHTVMEKLLEDLSFSATDRGGEAVLMEAAEVQEKVGELAKDSDLSKFIL